MPQFIDADAALAWSALILPKSAPRESDGEITYYAIGFGRQGYIELPGVTSRQKAEEIGHMADCFLAGLNFRPGRAYGDVQPTDRRAPDALAGALGIASLHKATLNVSFWSSDTIIPVVGSIVAAAGARSLFLYTQRHMRRESRRG